MLAVNVSRGVHHGGTGRNFYTGTFSYGGVYGCGILPIEVREYVYKHMYMCVIFHSTNLLIFHSTHLLEEEKILLQRVSGPRTAHEQEYERIEQSRRYDGAEHPTGYGLVGVGEVVRVVSPGKQSCGNRK